MKETLKSITGVSNKALHHLLTKGERSKIKQIVKLNKPKS